MRSRRPALSAASFLTLTCAVAAGLGAGCSRQTPATQATVEAHPVLPSATNATDTVDAPADHAAAVEARPVGGPASPPAPRPAARAEAEKDTHAAAPPPSADATSKRAAARLEEATLAAEFGVLGAAGGLGLAGSGSGRAAAPAPSAAWGSLAAAAGPIRAGEWDDNANYREFMKYLGAHGDPRLRRVDLRDRRFLVVRDEAGLPVPRCRVTVRDGERETTLTTVASGRAILFPRGEGLRVGNLVATAACGNQTARASFAVGQGDDGVVELRLAGRRDLPATRTIDVGFVLDTTSSMAEEIESVKATIQKVAAQLDVQGVRVRVGLVEYKDRGDEFVTRAFPLTEDVQGFARRVASVHASGGGDTPESMNEGLHAGLARLAWSPDAIARFAFLVADAPPHLDYPQDFDYAVDMKDAAHRGIQVFTVAASGMDDLGQGVFRQIAQYTGATNMFVLRGGAGPQSTGAGDPKTSCGTRHQNYESGNLDALVVGKIRHELRSLDRDPMRIPGLGQDENGKPCEQRVAFRE